MLKAVLVLLIGLGTIFPAFASSDDAWKIMRQKVRSGCVEKANAMKLGKVNVSVDPFGTQSYGTAIIIKHGASRQAKLAYICVMDKKTGLVEVSGELSLH
jgi:glycerate kinase